MSGDRTLPAWLQGIVAVAQIVGVVAIPIVLLIVGNSFAERQSETQRAVEDQRAQLTALEAYLDEIGTLLLEKGLRTTGEVDVRNLARARTLTMLDMLSPERKPRVLEFLFEMDLLQTTPSPGKRLNITPSDKRPVIGLRFADLHEVNMAKRHLLRSANLDRANLNRARLNRANLSDAKLPKAHLFRTHLRGTDLSNADLTEAFLIRSDLTDADLTDADLTDARLKYAKGLSCQQVKQAHSLEGATMPNGQEYEDWIKDKEGCGEG